MDKKNQTPDMFDDQQDEAAYTADSHHGDSANEDNVDYDLDTDLLDESEIMDEDHDHWEDDQSMYENQPTKKKSSNLIIIGVGVLAAATVLYFQVLKPKGPAGQMGAAEQSAPQTAEFAAQPVETVTATPPAENFPAEQSTAESSAADQPQEQQGFMTDPAMIAPAPEVTTATTQAAAEPLTPMPDFPTATDLQKADSAPAAESLPIAETTPAPATVEPSPAMPLVETPPAETAKIEAAAETPAPIAPTVNVNNESQEALLKAQQELQQAQARIAALEEQLQTAQQQASENAEKAAAAAKKAQDLADAAEQQIAAPVIEKSITPPESAPPESAPIAPDTTEAAKPEKPAAKKSAPKKEVVSSKRVEATSLIRWELRSAQDSRAMIAKQGSGDMVSVQVGETVPSLGKITAIHKTAEGWVVQGTKSRVVQSR